jgi:hypothetical protein
MRSVDPACRRRVNVSRELPTECPCQENNIHPARAERRDRPFTSLVAGAGQGRQIRWTVAAFDTTGAKWYVGECDSRRMRAPVLWAFRIAYQCVIPARFLDEDFESDLPRLIAQYRGRALRDRDVVIQRLWTEPRQRRAVA